MTDGSSALKPAAAKEAETVHDCIRVPFLSSKDLLDLAQKELNLTSIQADLLKWDFMGEDRGKLFEISSSWHPPISRTPEEKLLHALFLDDDPWDGHPAAFISWMIETSSVCNCATYNINGRWSRQWTGSLRLSVGQRKRRLEIATDLNSWQGMHFSLLFREVPQP